jgi:hypothetical protein
MTRWRAALGNSEARQIELVLPKEAWAGGAGMRELIVRRTGTSDVTPVFARQADVNGDGSPELILAADTGEVCCLTAEGKELWRRSLPAPPTALECVNLGDGPPAVLAATREARLYRLTPAGEIAWMADFLPLAKENGDLPIAYSISSWVNRDGKREIVCGNYNAVSFITPDGSRLEYCRAGGAFETMLLPEALDLTGDGVPDQLAFNVWASLSVIDGAQRKTVGYRAAPQGEGLCFEWWDKNPEKPLLVVAAENGVGLMDARSGQYVWRKDISPLSGCVIGDFGGDLGRAVVVAKRDGFVLAFSGAGELLRRTMVGEEIECACAVRAAEGVSRLVAATGERIVLFGPDLRRAVPLASGTATRLLPLQETGAFAALRPRVVAEGLRLPPTAR